MEESSTKEVSHQCVVPHWNQLPTTQQGRSLTHVQFQPSLTTSTPPFHFPQQMHIPTVVGAMHGADSNGVHLLPPMLMVPPLKPRWGSSDTLESIVREATLRDFSSPKPEDDGRTRLRSCTENHRQAMRIPGPTPPSQATPRKTSSVSERVSRKNTCLSSGTCASDSSTYNMREDDSNTMTTELTEEDDTSQDEAGSKDDEGHGRGGGGRTSRFSRQSKGTATTTHNLSKRRRRVRINEKMKALQKMVPNSSKTDKASMLDEVILYMKQLQAQVEMMKLIRSNATAAPNNDNFNVSRMMNSMITMPPAALPPQQLQMSLLARMGVGLGLGMLSHANTAAANNAFVTPTVPQPQLPPHFIMPQLIPMATFTESHLNSNISRPMASMALHNPYAALLARKISMENYNNNKLAALHQQRIRSHPIRSDKTQRQ